MKVTVIAWSPRWSWRWRRSPFPAFASAHPSVYTDDATNRHRTRPPARYTLGTQTRHVVTNHGFTMVLRETNGASNKGVMDYSQAAGRLPRDASARASGSPRATPPRRRTRPAGASRRSRPRRRSSAGRTTRTPFYNYVPFQKAAAGLEDDPARWIDDVLTLTRRGPGAGQRRPGPGARSCGAVPGLGGTFTPGGRDPDDHRLAQQWLRPPADRAAGRRDPPAQ